MVFGVSRSKNKCLITKNSINWCLILGSWVLRSKDECLWTERVMNWSLFVRVLGLVFEFLCWVLRVVNLDEGHL